MVSVIQLFWVACNLCSLFILSMCTQQIYTIACIYISRSVEKRTISLLRFLHSICVFLHCNFHHLVHRISFGWRVQTNKVCVWSMNYCRQFLTLYIRLFWLLYSLWQVSDRNVPDIQCSNRPSFTCIWVLFLFHSAVLNQPEQLWESLQYEPYLENL